MSRRPYFALAWLWLLLALASIMTFVYCLVVHAGVPMGLAYGSSLFGVWMAVQNAKSIKEDSE